ncbi:MAG: ankyrin repeat domain-containing protein [Endomicrobium sp.]|jgi:ankyrin repeat protein|nr:ankyrin repeat domain-containing protein [Endomicrobium sp.]
MEKIRKITGWLLIVYASLYLLTFFTVLFLVASALQKYGFQEGLDYISAWFKSYPVCSLTAAFALFYVFLLLSGISLARKKFNKTIAVIIFAACIIAGLQSDFLRRNNAGFINQMKFWAAIERNSPDDAIKLIKDGVNLNGVLFDFTDKPYMQFLPIAITRNKYDMAKILIENGADVNAVVPVFEGLGIGGYTVLSSALTAYPEPDADIIKFLLEKGADVNKSDINDYGFVPLIHSVISFGGNEQTGLEIVKLLTDHGADVNKTDKKSGTPPLVWAIAAHRGNALDIIKILVDNGADINFKDKNGMTPLLYAAKSSSFEICKYLIGKGADTAAKDSEGKSFSDYLKENGGISEADKAELEKLPAPETQKRK